MESRKFRKFRIQKSQKIFTKKIESRKFIKAKKNRIQKIQKIKEK